MRLNLGLLCCLAFPLWAADTQTAGFIQVVSVTPGIMERVASPARLFSIAIVVSNVSPKTITAYSYTVNATYADGSRETNNAMDDAISELVTDAIAPILGMPAVHQQFGPGQTRTISAFVPLAADGSAPVSLNAEIPTVVLDDGAAIGDGKDIAILDAGRKRTVNMISLQLTDLADIQASSPWQARAQELVSQFTAAASTNPEFAGRANLIKAIITGSAQNPRMLDQEVAGLTAFLSKLESYLNFGPGNN